MTNYKEAYTKSCDLSIIIPFHNEAGNIIPLMEEIQDSFKEERFEVIGIDDASDDATSDELLLAMEAYTFLRVIRHSKRLGQSMALRNGIFASYGEIIGMMDGDGQNPPTELYKLYKRLDLIRPHKGMVAGIRVNRSENQWRRFISSFANRLRRSLLKDKLTDAGCSLKVIDRQICLAMPGFKNMHRYLAILTIMVGGRIAEIEVTDRKRNSGQTKYSTIGRALSGIVDLLGVMWLKSGYRLVKVEEITIRR